MSKARIEIKTKYSDREFINYAKENIKDLIEGKRNSQLSEMFYIKTSGKERFRKIPFIIYWLVTKKGKFWTVENFKDSLEGKVKLRKENIDAVLRVIDELRKDPIIDNFFNDQYFEYYDIQRIFYRYQKERNGVVEKKMLEIIQKSSSFSQAIRKISTNLSSDISKYISDISKRFFATIEKYIELKYEILKYIESEGVVIQSEMRRYKRRFQKTNKELFKKIIYELEEEGRISIKTYSGRTFLIYRK